MRWKALIEMEKQQQDQVDRNIKEAREKLEMEMEAARHEHQVMLMRQDLMRRQESLGGWKSCTTKKCKNESNWCLGKRRSAGTERKRCDSNRKK